MHSLRKIRRFTICRTPVVNEPFGMHECIPYETSLQIPIRLNAVFIRQTQYQIHYIRRNPVLQRGKPFLSFGILNLQSYPQVKNQPNNKKQSKKGRNSLHFVI